MRAVSCYRLSAACLVTHELESALRQNGHPLSLSSGFEAALAEQVLVWAHMLIVLILLVLSETVYRAAFRYALCVFAVLHVGLHWFLRDLPVYDFSSMASWVLILLAGIFGAAYLVPAKAR